MPTFDVDVGGITYEVDAPDETTAWNWANYTHKQKKASPAEIPSTVLKEQPKEDFGILESMGVGAKTSLMGTGAAIGLVDEEDLAEQVKRQNLSSEQNPIATTVGKFGAMAGELVGTGLAVTAGAALVPGAAAATGAIVGAARLSKFLKGVLGAAPGATVVSSGQRDRKSVV